VKNSGANQLPHPGAARAHPECDFVKVGMAAISAARADEAQARSLFKAMSDYMAAQNAISLEYDSLLEIVTRENQKLGLASSGTVTLNRPDKIRMTRTGGFANVELVFDSKAVTLLVAPVIEHDGNF
jgi:hypothetical protein